MPADRKKTVKKRIFISNALMVLVTLMIFLVINMAVIKLYSEVIEQELKASLESATDKEAWRALADSFVARRDEFILLFLADGLLCIGGLVVVSQLFTKHLVNHIMEPLEALSEAAERVRRNDLTQAVEYEGDAEFENVCRTFNEMQESILKEQEKNDRYEAARTDMIAGISHDLRTPLTAVRGTIKGLLDGVAATPERQKKFLETAYRRTADMDILLNQLFYLSKLETGNMPIDLKRIELSDFIRRYAEGKKQLLEDGREELAVELNCGGYVLADPEQLQRIFDNLLENSRKYGGATPLRIKIRLDRTEKGFSVCFADNGAGVPEEKLPYVFDEFYRGDESRSRKEGNGLGLYIVKYLTEAMGGSVRARNEDGFAVYMELSSQTEEGEG